MVCQCRHHLNSGRFQCRSRYHCMAQHFCLSRLACWHCYNPVKQQYTIQAKKNNTFFFLPSQRGLLSFWMYPLLIHSSLSVLVGFNVCLSPLHLLDPFTQGYKRFSFFIWLLLPRGSQYSSLFSSACTVPAYFTAAVTVLFFINCYNAYLWFGSPWYFTYMIFLVRYLLCQDFSMVVLCFFLLSLSAYFLIQPTLLFIYSQESLDNYGVKR